MKVLIDTNVIMDYLAMRVPDYENACKVIEKCVTGKIEGAIAAHSVTNLFYILKKEYTVIECRDMLIEVCNLFDIIGIDKEKLMTCLLNDAFKDFEDCLQAECALSVNADYIVTRNIKDFNESPVKAVLPEDFLKMF